MYSKSKELADAEVEARNLKQGLWVDMESVPLAKASLP
jgi:hypothetical protein